MNTRSEVRDGYKPGTCYRCWQVGTPGVRATCVVMYNVGLKDQWKALSCDACLNRDIAAHAGKVRTIARLVQ
jgi:hypothetical protein